jgi:hypothetical protein
VLGERALLRGAEGIEVDRRRLGQLLHLVVADLDPGSACDGVASLVEGSAGRLGGCQLAPPVRVPLDGQVAHPVGRVKVRLPTAVVGEPVDDHRAHDDAQHLPWPGSTAPAHAVGACANSKPNQCWAGGSHRAEGKVRCQD